MVRWLWVGGCCVRVHCVHRARFGWFVRSPFVFIFLCSDRLLPVQSRVDEVGEQTHVFVVNELEALCLWQVEVHQKEHLQINKLFPFYHLFQEKSVFVMPQSFMSGAYSFSLFEKREKPHSENYEACRLHISPWLWSRRAQTEEEVHQTEHAEHRPVDQPVRVVWRSDGANCLKFHYFVFWLT